MHIAEPNQRWTNAPNSRVFNMRADQNLGDTADLLLAIKGLGTSRSILHIGAHPDDEDVGMIAYFARKYGARVVYWSATRGEGGQNKIGAYKGEFLGVFRTWESQQARAIDGGECLFGPFIDYGYSKNGAEALAKWGQDALVREIVRAVRTVQPQIVIGRWQGDIRDGHGHHQAVGIATRAAFVAAGDPKQFQELHNAGLSPWHPQRLLFSTSGDWQPGEDGSFGQLDMELEKEGALRINTGEFDPLTGQSFQETAWSGFNSHRTQAMGFLPEAGDYYYYYRSDENAQKLAFSTTDMFAGIDTGLTDIAVQTTAGKDAVLRAFERVQHHADAALCHFRADAQEISGAEILAGLNELTTLGARLDDLDIDADNKGALSHALNRLIKRFSMAASRCLGLRLEVVSSSWRLTPGQTYRIEARLWHGATNKFVDVKFNSLWPENWKTEIVETSMKKGRTTVVYEVTVSEMAELSCPYWLRSRHSRYIYDWPKGPSAGRAFAKDDLRVNCVIKTETGILEVTKPVLFREGFSAGFRELEAKVVPPVSIETDYTARFLPVSGRARSFEINVSITCNLENCRTDGNLCLVSADGWKVTPKRIPFSLLKNGAVFSGKFTVTVPSSANAGQFNLNAEAHIGDRIYNHMLSSVMMGAPNLPKQPSEANCVKEEFLIDAALVRIKLMDVNFAPEIKVGYLAGVDEDVKNALDDFPIDIEELTDHDIRSGDLQKFDVIIVGPNAYLLRDQTRKNSAKILKYVEQGGTLIVQFQGYGYADAGCAPYPFEYSQPHDRVTHETAPVGFLKPGHSVLNYPNKLDKTDFDGWVHDRGMYFFGTSDSRYEPILQCHDPGENSKTGGLMIAGYGKGTYVYAAYSFHRQLPAGVDGAFRFFANLLSLPYARILHRIEVLRNVPIFSVMPDDQMEKLARACCDQTIEDGHYLCRQGDEGAELYVVVEGAIEILSAGSDGERLLNTCKPGEYVGEMAALAKRPRSASLRAKGKTTLLSLPGQDVRELLHKNPEMTDIVIAELTDRLVKAQTAPPEK